MAYLVESSQGEHAVIRKLEGLLTLLTEFFASLKFNPYYCWFLLEIEMSDLVSSFRGDVDILVGQLRVRNPDDFNRIHERYSIELPNAHPTWPFYLAALEVADSGGIEWPPRTDYLVGIETKYLYLDPTAPEITTDAVKSQKSSPRAVRRIRLKIEHLIEMGFDKVALLEFIGNPPANGTDSRAWSLASSVAHASQDAVSNIFRKRLLENTVAGHWVCSIGAVAGGDETVRGAGGATKYRSVGENPFLSDPEVTSRRQELQKNVQSILSNFPTPRYFPALYINCKPCKQLHCSFLNNQCNAYYNATRHGIEAATL